MDDSYLIKAAKQWAEGPLGDAAPPVGLYNLGVHAAVKVPHQSEGTVVQWSSYIYDLSFESAFDDTMVPSEGEFCLYNLTDATIAKIELGLIGACHGGYGVGDKSDQGVWLFGWITGVETEWKGPDKITRVHVVNVSSGSPSGIQNPRREQAALGEGGSRVNLTYAAPVQASYILHDLCQKSGLPIAEFAPVCERTFSQSVSVEGDINRKIGEFASICGVWAYPIEGLLYVKDMRNDPGQNVFLLRETSGLVGTPAPWQEVVRDTRAAAGESAEDRVYTGYKIRCLLDHRIHTGVGVELQAKNVQGRFTVKSGRHVYSGVGGYTEAVVIA